MLKFTPNMAFNSWKYLATTALLAITTLSCSVTKRLPEGDYLLTRNNIAITYHDSTHKDNKVRSSELERFIPISQTPNKRILGANIFLWIYNMANPAKDNGFHRFLRRIGEKPVIYSAQESQKSSKEMGLFMDSKGFLGSTVVDTVKYKRKRAYVNYNVSAARPWTIESLEYQFRDQAIAPLVMADTASSLVKTGGLFDRNLLELERARIAQMLQDAGYYQFTTNNIRFVVDTLQQNYKAKIKTVITKNRVAGEVEDNKIYRIRNIYINTNYQPTLGVDTVAYDTISNSGYHFVHRKGEKPNVHSSVMTEAMTLYPNMLYSGSQIKQTSSNISNLKFFKTVNIMFKEVQQKDSTFITFIGDNDSLYRAPEGVIDCSIVCAPSKKQNYNIDFETSTNSNYTSVAFSVGYGNKNIFKRAEIFNVGLFSSYDFMRTVDARDSYQYGSSVSLTFPRLVAPKFVNRSKSLRGVSTVAELYASWQQRPDYDRMVLNGSFGYRWTSLKRFTYTVKPLNISIIDVPWISDSFLEDIENPYLKNSYSSQLILGMLGSFNYTETVHGGLSSYTLKLNSETSGNLLGLITWLADSNREQAEAESYREVFGIKYSQYVRADLDFSTRHIISDRTNDVLAFRLFLGGGYAYGNTQSLPFERMFFAGGSNSMRGWQVRALGPGATEAVTSSSYSYQVGNIRFETNLEQRFSIWGPLNGAIFVDAGNIWYNVADDEDSVARFKWESCLNQIALNTGLGARLDFGFFVLRVDWGIQLYNPGWESGQRWISGFDFDNTAIHFGIGYPF